MTETKKTNSYYFELFSKDWKLIGDKTIDCVNEKEIKQLEKDYKQTWIKYKKYNLVEKKD